MLIIVRRNGGHMTADDTRTMRSTDRSLPIALLRAREKVMDHYRPLLQKHDLTEQQWRVIRVLDEAPGMDMGALSAAANILAPSLSRMTKSLEERGYLTMRRTPGDGRRASLSLTEKGKTLLRTIAPESAAVSAEIEAKVGPDRIATLLDDLDALIRDLN
jgi:homoprotocatechuate degradation regulator HpaR